MTRLIKLPWGKLELCIKRKLLLLLTDMAMNRILLAAHSAAGLPVTFQTFSSKLAGRGVASSTQNNNCIHAKQVWT